MDQYLMYLRKSRADIEAEERGEGETLARHEKALLELAQRLNLNVSAIYKEIVSGETIASRPFMQQLLSEVESGIWKGVLVMEVERLARGDTMDQGLFAQTFKYSSTKIITPSKIYDPDNEFDEEYFEFGLFMSRREYKTTNRRLQRGRLSSIKEGKYVGNITSYGYDRVKLIKEKGFTLTPVPDQAEIVRMIYELYTKGEMDDKGNLRHLGVSLIARRLNQLKIKPKKGDAWVDSTIRGILTNPVYIGKVRWNRRPTVKKMVNGKIEKIRPISDNIILVDGLHEPIISEDIFNLAQNIMKSNKRTPLTDRSTLTNPLAGLVVCGKCGRVMRRRPKGERSPYDTITCSAAHCNNIGVRFESVEKRVLFVLEKYLDNYKLSYNFEIQDNKSSTKTKVMQKKLQQFDIELAEAKTQLDTIYDSYEKGIYSSDIFIQRSKTLTSRIDNITADKEKIEQELKTKNNDSSEYIIPIIEQILGVYNELPTAQAKNDVLKKAIKNIIYTKERSAAWKGVDPDDYDLKVNLILS